MSSNPQSSDVPARLSLEEIALRIKQLPVNSPEQQRALAAFKAKYGGRIAPSTSLSSFISQANPKFQWYEHCKRVSSVLQRVADGELKRVMLFLPPRHSKSLQASQLFPAYYLRRNPSHWAGDISYSADLSYLHSRAARRYYIGGSGNTSSASDPSIKSGVELWETSNGGGLFASGIGGPITGKGVNYASVDDPIKNQEEAFSSSVRENHKNWWQSTFYTRLEPDSAIVLAMARWHEDDLAGWLLNEDEQEDGVEPWHIVDFPAIYESRDAIESKYPDNCTIEPDWREPGEALCPERYPLARLLKIKGSIGELWWNALYQQRPSTTVNKGRVYYNFTDKNVRPCRDLGGDLWVGLDFNVSPMCAVIASKAIDELHVFDEIKSDDSGTHEVCEEIARRYPNRSINVCPDASGKDRHTNSPSTDFDIIRQHGFIIHSAQSNPAIVDRVNEVNNLCGDIDIVDEHGNRGTRKPRLFMDPAKCKHAIKCMKRLAYKPGTSSIDKGKGLDHAPDGLGYLVHYLFPIVELMSGAVWGRK